MHVGCINEIKGKNWIHGCLKHIIMFLNIKRRNNDRRIGLLRHAYQQNGAVRWDFAHFQRGRMYGTRIVRVSFRTSKIWITKIVTLVSENNIRKNIYIWTIRFTMRLSLPYLASMKVIWTHHNMTNVSIITSLNVPLTKVMEEAALPAYI